MSFAGPPGARSSTERKRSTPTRLRYFGTDDGAKFRDHANANFKGMARIRVKPDWVELIDLQTDIPAPNEAQKPGSAERISEYLSLYSDVRSHTLDKVESRAPDSHGHGPLPERLLGLDEAQHLAERFKLLADPSRLRMIYALLEAGEVCVSDLARLVEVSESATSHQLRQLRLAGLVRARKQGREVFYRVADTHVRLLLDVAVEHYLHGHDADR